MTPDEVGSLLAIAAAFDLRLTPPSDADAMARAVAWSAALADDMDFYTARQFVIGHYASQDDLLTPAKLNRLWRLEETRRNEFAERERRERASLVSVPMPAEIRKRLKDFGRLND
jgi:hypothetical protein